MRGRGGRATVGDVSPVAPARRGRNDRAARPARLEHGPDAARRVGRALGTLGHGAVTSRESTTVSWLEVGSLRCRGYVLVQGRHVEAINFELALPEPAPAVRVIEAAAASLGWEVHEDDGPDDDE